MLTPSPPREPQMNSNIYIRWLLQQCGGIRQKVLAQTGRPLHRPQCDSVIPVMSNEAVAVSEIRVVGYFQFSRG
jgi:hypothetical protein